MCWYSIYGSVSTPNLVQPRARRGGGEHVTKKIWVIYRKGSVVCTLFITPTPIFGALLVCSQKHSGPYVLAHVTSNGHSPFIMIQEAVLIQTSKITEVDVLDVLVPAFPIVILRCTCLTQSGISISKLLEFIRRLQVNDCRALYRHFFIFLCTQLLIRPSVCWMRI